MGKGAKAAGAAGGFLKKQLGDLIRPAKKRAARSADYDRAVRDAMDTNVRDMLPPSRKLPTHGERMDAARAARDASHDDMVRKWNQPGTTKAQALGHKDAQVVTGVADSDGFSAAGTNFKTPDGRGCAEDGALRNLNAERGRHGYPPLDRDDPNLSYSEARKIDKDGNYIEKPICGRNCQEVSEPTQYPENVEYDRGWRWDLMGGGFA